MSLNDNLIPFTRLTTSDRDIMSHGIKETFFAFTFFAPSHTLVNQIKFI